MLRKPRVKWSDNCTPYLGCNYDSSDIYSELDKWGDKVVVEDVDDDKVVDLLIEQNIISVFGGGSESGRRGFR